jgi:hypothetical protein
MNKLAVFAALAIAANSKYTPVDNAYEDCFYWDVTTEAYVASAYVGANSAALATTDYNSVTYNYAFEIELDYTNSEYWCDNVFVSDFALDWTLNGSDDDTMLIIAYEEWAVDATTGYCTGSYAYDGSTAISAPAGLSPATDGYCAYDVYFLYDDGTASGSATYMSIDVYLDNSVFTAASAFAVAGVAAMFL